MKNLCFTFLILMLANTNYSQVNLKVGYLANFIEPDNLNSLFEQFNEERPWLEKDFDRIRYVNGLKLGVGYRIDDVEFDLSYNTRFRTLEASGTDPSDDSSLIRKVSVRLNGISLGMEYHISMISIGGNVGRDNLLLKFNDSEGTSSETISDEAAWSTGLFISLNTKKSNFMSLSLRPFARVYWSDYDISNLAEKLEVNSTGNVLNQNLFHFGIALIFNNG